MYIYVYIYIYIYIYIHLSMIEGKYIIDYMNFSLNTFLVSISGLPLVFTKVKILLSVCKLNNNTRM